jgi:DNA-binding response OmpR family regulator
LHALRQDAGLAHLPVLLIIAKSHWGAVYPGYSEGWDGYLTKPFHPTELTRQLQRLLGSAGSAF